MFPNWYYTVVQLFAQDILLNRAYETPLERIWKDALRNYGHRCVYKFEAACPLIRPTRSAQIRVDTICRITWSAHFSAEIR